jgi:hypothetical protein
MSKTPNEKWRDIERRLAALESVHEELSSRVADIASSNLDTMRTTRDEIRNLRIETAKLVSATKRLDGKPDEPDRTEPRPDPVRPPMVVVALVPAEAGRFDVCLADRIIVANTAAPFRDAARALLDQGLASPDHDVVLVYQDRLATVAELVAVEDKPASPVVTSLN